MASMRDVAARAGVSVATVSHVINNTRFVSDETRGRVQAAIEELNYSPDVIARIFKTGHKQIIGYVVPNINDQFFSALIEAVENELSSQGYRLIVANTHETAQREIESIRALSNGMVDGLLVASTLHSYDDVRCVVPADFPMVFLDRMLPFCPHDSVRVSTYDALVEATEQLICDRHRRIVFLRNSVYLSTTIERCQAYEQTMRRYGLEPHFIQLTDTTSTRLQAYLDQAMEWGATALIAPNNIITMASADYLFGRGLAIGTDIDLVAFQETMESNILLRHASLVCQPVVELGRTAAQKMLERLVKPDLPVRETVLQATYIPKA